MKSKVVINLKHFKEGYEVDIKSKETPAEVTKTICAAVVSLCIEYNLDEDSLFDAIKKDIKIIKKIRRKNENI